MLVPAMAFGWYVMSARAETVARASAAASARREASVLAAPAPVTPPTIDGQQLEPIRTAIPPSVIERARALVNLPMGAREVDEIEGRRYVFVLERHYHPPGFVGAPNGWHKGVTAYALRTPVSAD
jgi:hypothetical protein